MNRTTTNNSFRQESQALGIGVTNPSHKRYNHKESGLQTPPTRDTPIPTRDTPIKESGLQTPPTRDTPIPTRDIPIKNQGYKPLLQEI